METFFNSIVKESVSDHVRAVIVSLLEELQELKREKAANDGIHTEMAIQYNELKDRYESLKKEHKDICEQYAKEIDKNAINNRTIFGAHTEKMLNLIENASNKTEGFIDEAESEDEAEENQKRVIDFEAFKDRDDKNKSKEKCKNPGSTSVKRKRSFKDSLDRLPQQYEYLLDTDNLNDTYGCGNWRIAGWHVHRAIEKLPIEYYTKNIYTPTISHGLDHKLETLPFCNPLIDKSYVSASFLADIIYRKFVLSLPVYRQSVDYCSQGIIIPRQTIIRWINRIIPVIFTPVYEYMLGLLIKQGYIQCDESIIKVNRDNRSSSSKSYMWVHTSSELLDCNPIVIFAYEATRSTDHLRSMFGEFLGYITCDAYISYQVFEKENEGISISGCLMHTRRYLAIAFFLNNVADMTNDEIMALPETKALLLIRDIYAAEKPLRNLTANERLKRRQTEVKPAVDLFFEYIHELDESDEIFSDRLKKAITYAINQEKYLRRFLDDGNIPCDNGHSERIIRSYSIGRANWLFADTIAGAKVNAMVYSITETAKANRVNVEIYLRYLFEKIPRESKSGILKMEELMPWSEAYHKYEEEMKTNSLDMFKGLFPIPEKPSTPRKKDSNVISLVGDKDVNANNPAIHIV